MVRPAKTHRTPLRDGTHRKAPTLFTLQGMATYMSLVIGLAAVLTSSGPVAPAGAQTGPAPGAPRLTPVRAVLASRGLPSVVEAPLYFRLLRVQVPAGQSTGSGGANGFVYQLTGVLEVASDGDLTTLREGEAAFVVAGKSATLKAVGTAPATFLHFLLLRSADLNLPVGGAPAVVTKLYQNRDPIPGLKPGPYEFTLTRVTFPPRTPTNPPHHRSGAALYSVVAGTGMITLTSEGRSEARPAGTVQYEPYDFVHQWGNPGDTPLVLLQANISPEGTPVVIFPK